MARPRKTELLRSLHRKGYDVDEMDRYELLIARDRKREELEKLEEELDEKLEVANKLTFILSEIRRLLCDNNVWTVIRNTLADPGAITMDVTRGYGMDHKKALQEATRLIKEGYIIRSDLELDPIRQRYVRYQYPGPKLFELLEELAQTINEYQKSYEEILKLKMRIKDTVETINQLEKYIKYYAK